VHELNKTKRVVKPTTAYADHVYSDDDTISASSLERSGLPTLPTDADDETRRVTVWNPKTGKKLSGNAGVFKKNLAKYLRTHPDWVVWTGHEKAAEIKRRREYEAPHQSPNKRRMLETYKTCPAGYAMGYPSYDLQSSHQEPLFTTAQLWRSLLVVCSEKSILAEVDASAESDYEPDEEGQYPRCAQVMNVNGMQPRFHSFTSPAVG